MTKHSSNTTTFVAMIDNKAGISLVAYGALVTLFCNHGINSFGAYSVSRLHVPPSFLLLTVIPLSVDSIVGIAAILAPAMPSVFTSFLPMKDF
jgi:hypothetical protein